MDTGDLTGEVLQALEFLFSPGRIIEVRVIGQDGISSGYYNDYTRAAVDLLARDADPRVSGIYVTLNEVNPALLARRANRIKFRLGKNDSSTADSDILHRQWLPIDIDPARPSGVSSTDQEHAAALSLARTIRDFLSRSGWPEPLLGDSGNGAHLLYPIDLPNDDESRTIVRQVLELLDVRFSGTVCRVDTANYNASRIWKVYGTTARKGDNLPERPHRRSRIITAPSGSKSLVKEDLDSLLSRFPVAEKLPGKKMKEIPMGDEHCTAIGDTRDLGAWLTGHHLTFTAKPYLGGRLFVFDACPFSDAHTDGAYAIQFENGAIFAGCHHDSCGSGKQRWPELRARYEGKKQDAIERLAKPRSDRIRKGKEAEESFVPVHNTSLPVPEPESPITGSVTPKDTIQTRSQEILSQGDPLSYLLSTFSQAHEGDLQVAECLVHSLVSRSVMNSKGLHVSISGESGKGKSHAIETMQSLIPPAYRIEGRVSDKALFYLEDMQPGTVITLDDITLSDQMQEILKGVTTSFQKPFQYRTVNKDRKPQVCIIPQRCVWWIAKVEGAGDDQVFNRMLTCWIDDTEQQDQRVLDRTLANAEEMPDRIPGRSDDVTICRQIWADLSPVWVVIPFARRIRFQSSQNRRNPDMFLDLIRSHAALCQHQRETKEVNGVTCVMATRDDFNQAARLFTALNGKNGGQATKLTRRESALIAALESLQEAEVTVARLQQVTGIASSSITKLLHGYRSYEKTYSGLLEKCPAVSFHDRTETRGDDGSTTSRRARVYAWDPVLYHSWKKGGSVWLVDDDHKPGDGNPPGDTGDVTYSGDKKQEEESHETTPPDNQESGNMDTASPPACSLSSIIPQDFTPIDGFPDRNRCSVCGKRPTRYREHKSRLNSQHPDRPDRMLCHSCYNRAVSRIAASIIPLPGVIQTSTMIPLQSSVGKCHLCNLSPATWSDPQAGIHLCDACYHRERAEKNTAAHASVAHASGPPSG